MARVFWNHQDFLLVDFHTRGATVNVTSYCATLDRLRNTFRKKRPELLPKGVLVLHDNGRPNTTSVTRDLKQIFLWNILEHPFCSPDFAPSDFHYFGPLKKHLANRRFRTYAEIQEAVVKWFRDLNPDFLYAGFDRLIGLPMTQMLQQPC
ncbi:Mariner Mos1 transposase [Araneus ventricosus]|uniref:Mariner Mos1 transposase n=1 Tax=Araneus ventricosus TaxID=182803 RepID=A0A4Y2SAG7_ARAVE|nr:Mariner Mos1 transposase [Araneus ventricosus]